MTDEIAGKVLDAYKTSPLLTGLLLLSFIIFTAFGWYTLKKDEKMEAFVVHMIDDQKALQRELIDLSKTCRK